MLSKFGNKSIQKLLILANKANYTRGLMKKEIKVPAMGESISEITIGHLLVTSGSIVKMDQEILELETDKVNQVLYAPISGRIEIEVKSGDIVKIGDRIGCIEVIKAEDSKEGIKEPENLKKETAKLEQPVLEKKGLKITAEQFVNDLKKETPSGYSKESQYQIGKGDEEDRFGKAAASPNGKFQLEDGITKRETRRPMTKIRKVIAQRLVQAHKEMAMLTTFNEVDLTQVIFLREKYKEEFPKKYGCKLGFMSFFVKAVISALHAYPNLNAFIDGDEIVQREYFNIGVAVGTDKGVIVPVIRNCDQLTFAEIEQQIENYAKKAREGGLVADDLQGGGFTITNGGVYGSLLSTPILLPPQCGILGMHKIEKRPVVINDQITIRSMMYLALSYDHRLIDGKEAVSFLVHIKNILEEPSRLLLEV